jgi:spore coat polysaccharide biosynthesis predicted glycosyltransferase SpsG
MNCRNFKKIIVVTGSAYQKSNEIQRIVEKDKRIEHHHNIDSIKIHELMVESNLAIAPSSSVLLELFSVGVPAITGYYADNQKRGSEAISAMNLAVSCGNMKMDYSKKLEKVLNDLKLEDGIRIVQNQKAIKWAGKKFYLNIFRAL